MKVITSAMEEEVLLWGLNVCKFGIFFVWYLQSPGQMPLFGNNKGQQQYIPIIIVFSRMAYAAISYLYGVLYHNELQKNDALRYPKS